MFFKNFQKRIENDIKSVYNCIVVTTSDRKSIS